MKKSAQKVRKSATWAVILTQSMSLPISANAIDNSDIGKGTVALFKDVCSWMTIYGPVICAAAAAYFLVRKSMADESDGKMWMKRIVGAVICGVVIPLVAGVITLITSYYV